MIRAALDGLGVDYEEVAGEAAFYGPKIDLQITDPQGREETLSTVQVDSHLPARFSLTFQRAGNNERPEMVHRSIVSTMERMVAHLLEVHNGALPVWLAPVQVIILPVDIEAAAHAAKIRFALGAAGLRAEIDDRDATLAARVRVAQQQRPPYLAVVGAREAQTDQVSVRLRGGSQLPPMSVTNLVAMVKSAAETHAICDV
jgi:threonyl-tRNA synthetase